MYRRFYKGHPNLKIYLITEYNKYKDDMNDRFIKFIIGIIHGNCFNFLNYFHRKTVLL